MTFAAAFDEFLRLHGIAQKKKQAYSQAQAAADEKLASVRRLCSVLIRNAITTYNKSKPILLIDVGGVEFTVDVDNKRLNFTTVVLRYHTGAQPNESLDSDDERLLIEAFRQVIEAELGKENIPLQFGTFTVPSEYFAK